LVLGRECHVGQHVGFALVHQNGQFRPARAELVGDVPPDFDSPFLVGLIEGLPDRGGHDGMLALRHMGQRVAHPMHAASLPGGIEDPPDRRRQPGVSVRDHQFQSVQPAGFQAA
jgi:hypothetical protein